MKNLIHRTVRPAEVRAMIPQHSRMKVTRTFVETGDERCPIRLLAALPIGKPYRISDHRNVAK